MNNGFLPILAIVCIFGLIYSKSERQIKQPFKPTKQYAELSENARKIADLIIQSHNTTYKKSVVSLNHALIFDVFAAIQYAQNNGIEVNLDEFSKEKAEMTIHK